jgi:MerR family transcriptional regulator/heat shock protein HspR
MNGKKPPEKRRDGRATSDPAQMDDRAVYIISVAAELAGVHPQTLRNYEREGLLRPKRTSGNTRRYSPRDLARLQMIQQLTQDGVSLAGVRMIMKMERELDEMRERMDRMSRQLEQARRSARQVAESRIPRAEIVPLRSLFQLPWEGGIR